MRTALSILLLVGCKGIIEDGGGGPGGVTDPSDQTNPVLTVSTPERGTMAEDAMVRVTGIASDESAIASLTVNGQTVAVMPDGNFTASVPLTPGLTMIETRLMDRGGNLARDVRAVLHGTLAPADTMVNKAVAGKLGPGAIGVLAKLVERYASSLDLMSMVGNTRMVDEGGSCLGVEVDLRSIEKSGVTLGITPQAGALGANLVVSSLRVTLHADYDVACIGGSATIQITADRMNLTGSLALAVQGEQLSVSVPDLNVSFDNFNLNIGGVPGAIENMIEGKVESEASNAIENALRNAIPSKASELLAEFLASSYQVSIADYTSTITIRPSLVQLDATGAMIALDSKIAVMGGEGAVFLSSPSEPPATLMAEMDGLGVGLADDLANQLFAGLWAARALDQTVNLPADHPGRVFFGEVPDKIEIALSLPPTINADAEGNMRLAIGDLILKLIDTDTGHGQTAEIALSADVQFAVQITPDGRLVLTTQSPRTWAQVIEQTAAQDPQLDADVVESLGGVIAQQVSGLADEALAGLPVPLIGDALASDASATSGGGYVLLRATLTPPP